MLCSAYYPFTNHIFFAILFHPFEIWSQTSATKTIGPWKVMEGILGAANPALVWSYWRLWKNRCPQGVSLKPLLQILQVQQRGIRNLFWVFQNHSTPFELNPTTSVAGIYAGTTSSCRNYWRASRGSILDLGFGFTQYRFVLPQCSSSPPLCVVDVTAEGVIPPWVLVSHRCSMSKVRFEVEHLFFWASVNVLFFRVRWSWVSFFH